MTHSRSLLASLLFLSFLGSCRKQSPASAEIEMLNLTKGVTIESVSHLGNHWQVITMDPDISRPSVRLSNAGGKPLRDFSAFENAAQKAHEEIIWMMNAGMYHQDGSPVGLCICDGREVSPINRSDGEGNFFLKPNGIFALTEKEAQIIETKEWNPAMAQTVRCATQSGPLLVNRGKLHPDIRPNSPNKLIRNGVGIRTDGHLCFVISTSPVCFHEMALFFCDHLKCPDALYLDGTVSALYAPKAGLTQHAKGLGPVLGLWESPPTQGAKE